MRSSATSGSRSARTARNLVRGESARRASSGPTATGNAKRKIGKKSTAGTARSCSKYLFRRPRGGGKQRRPPKAITAARCARTARPRVPNSNVTPVGSGDIATNSVKRAIGKPSTDWSARICSSRCLCRLKLAGGKNAAAAAATTGLQLHPEEAEGLVTPVMKTVMSTCVPAAGTTRCAAHSTDATLSNASVEPRHHALRFARTGALRPECDALASDPF